MATLYYVVSFGIFKIGAIKRLAERLGDFERFGMPDDVADTCKNLNLFTYAFGIYCFTAPVIYAILSATILNHNDLCMERRRKNGSYNICTAMLNVWLPSFMLDALNPTNVFLVQSVTITALCTLSGSSFSIIFSFVEYIIVRIDHLRQKYLRVIFATNNKDDQKRRLKESIFYHLYIME